MTRSDVLEVTLKLLEDKPSTHLDMNDKSGLCLDGSTRMYEKGRGKQSHCKSMNSISLGMESTQQVPPKTNYTLANKAIVSNTQ
jgi:hypothetical protein